MGVRILNDTQDSVACFFCSTTEVAFGPLFHDEKEHDASDRAESFLRYLKGRDPRRMAQPELIAAHAVWRRQEADQWKREDEERENA